MPFDPNYIPDLDDEENTKSPIKQNNVRDTSVELEESGDETINPPQPAKPKKIKPKNRGRSKGFSNSKGKGKAKEKADYIFIEIR